VKKPEDSADAAYLPQTEDFSHRRREGATQPQSAAARRGPDDSHSDTSSIPDDPRLLQAVHEYMEELEAGKKPDRQQWLARYPDLRDSLAQCLEGLDILHQAAPRGQSPLLGGLLTAGQGGESLPQNPVGDFQIVREIGRGGMGIVYEAIQLSLGRRVAMKVLPFAATFDSKQLQRFRQEAQAAAQLHHTNIVPVYAVGCERGIHYYAMQLIEGHSLDFVIRQLQQEPGKKKNSEGGRRNSEGGGPSSEGTIPNSELRTPNSSSADTLGRLSAHFSTLRTGSRGSSIATSSPPTCSSTSAAMSGSRISDWPISASIRVSRRPAICWARSAT